ncbi:hypothetical protein C7S17_4015 [Burkholderia thailandensis]|nr:hypothetical protein [Burkholderia thailandensis]
MATPPTGVHLRLGSSVFDRRIGAHKDLQPHAAIQDRSAAGRRMPG